MFDWLKKVPEPQIEKVVDFRQAYIDGIQREFRFLKMTPEEKEQFYKEMKVVVEGDALWICFNEIIREQLEIFTLKSLSPDQDDHARTVIRILVNIVEKKIKDFASMAKKPLLDDMDKFQIL